MDWEKRIEEWELHPVTQMFKAEIQDDILYLTEALIDTSPIVLEGGHVKHKTSEDYMQTRGMIKALRGVLGMGLTDPIRNPNDKGV